MITFYNDEKAFFDTVGKLLYIKTILFGVIFAVIYLWIFVNFLSILNEEIWVVHGIVNMIPFFIIKKNQRVREQICAKTGSKI